MGGDVAHHAGGGQNPGPSRPDIPRSFQRRQKISDFVSTLTGFCCPIDVTARKQLPDLSGLPIHPPFTQLHPAAARHFPCVAALA
jgi:hypothetical protein